MRILEFQHHHIEIFGEDTGAFGAAQDSRPVIWMPVFAGDGAKIWSALCHLDRLPPDCVLICLSGMDWKRDLSPWPAPDFGGNAAAFLNRLTDRLLPLVEETLPFPVLDRGLAGYSMAGLFAVYTLYQSGLFHRIACVSGSLWYDGFAAYALTHPIAAPAPVLYASIGSREHRTADPRMRTVRSHTDQLVRHWQEQFPVCYEINPGGHFNDPAGRMARAIRRLLSLP